jgi:hypothetical protein
MGHREARQLDSWTRIWLGCAALWSLGLVAGGLFVTSYTSTNGPGQTLVQVNGDKVILILMVPFAAVAIVALALRHRRRVQLPGVGILVWVIFGLLVVLVLLGAFTIGPFIGPVAVFVIVAITRVKGQVPIST